MARGLSALLTGVWLFIGVVTLLNEPEPVTWESWFMGGAIVTAVLLTAVAWWNDRVVGKIILNWRAI